MRRVRKADGVAQALGKELGRSQILLGTLPQK